MLFRPVLTSEQKTCFLINIPYSSLGINKYSAIHNVSTFYLALDLFLNGPVGFYFLFTKCCAGNVPTLDSGMGDIKPFLPSVGSGC
jgi:hypothetical protein